MVLSPTSFRFAAPLSPHVAGGTTTTRRSTRPDWVLLHQSARISGHRNASTAECHTMEGQPIQASFWLVDPPGVSYFSVHCPGLDPNDFALEPDILCADAAFLLFSVDFAPVPGRSFRDPGRRCTQRFLYRAGPGKPSLHLVPDPDIVRPNGVYALLPFDSDDHHYAVVFLHRRSLPEDMTRYYDLHVFSSATQAWSCKGTLPGLSQHDQQLLAQAKHAIYKVIKVGETSLGFVDLSWGILLVRHVFSDRPLINYIPLPASRVSNLDEDGEPYVAPDYCCDVSSCGTLIKFVEVEFDDRDRRSLGNQPWKATIWNRDLSSLDDDEWRVRSSLNAANISVDPSYSHLLPPELWNDKTNELDLKKLVFCKPTLSNHDDDLLYIMSKLNCQDDKAWVISVDMKHASVEAIAPYSNKGCTLDASYCPCAFPKYLDLTTPEDGMTQNFKRISVADCVLQVMLTQDWFLKLDKCLESEGATDDECRSLLHCCPVSSLLLDMQEVLKDASDYGEGETASNPADVCSRALEDFNMLLKSPSDPLSCTEALRSKISIALGALESFLHTVSPTVRVLADACHEERRRAKPELGQKPGQTKDYKLQGFPANLSHGKKPGGTKDSLNGRSGQSNQSPPDHRDERARVQLERPKSLSYLMMILCLVLAYVLAPIIQKMLGRHLSLQ